MAENGNGASKRELEGEGGEQPAKAPRRNRWDTPAESTASVTPAAAAVNGLALPDLSSVQAAKELAKDALAKAQRAAEIQQAVNAKMGSLVGLPPGLDLKPKAAAQTVRLDAQGRLLDENGKVIQSTARPVTSIMANANAAQNPMLSVEAPPDLANNKYFDPRMQLPGEAREKRKSRAFNFVAEGSWSRKGDDLRAKAAVEHMLAEAKMKSKAPKHSMVGKDDHSLPALNAGWAAGGGDGAAGSSSGAVKTATAVSSATLKQKLAEVRPRPSPSLLRGRHRLPRPCACTAAPVRAPPPPSPRPVEAPAFTLPLPPTPFPLPLPAPTHPARTLSVSGACGRVVGHAAAARQLVRRGAGKLARGQQYAARRLEPQDEP